MDSPRPKPKRITLADVARLAGVSVQTVSHVLAGNETVRIPESTRQRVRDAAQQVGYRPNRLAQAMRSGKTNVVAVWMPFTRFVPNYVRIIQALYDQAHQAGYDLIVAGLDAKALLQPGGRLPPVWAVDGIIAVDAGKAIETLRKDPHFNHIPVVIQGYEKFENTDAVAWDLVGAAREGTEKLIASGAKRIVHLTLDWVFEDFPNERRRRGYTEAMEAAGLPLEIWPLPAESSNVVEQAIAQMLIERGVPDAFYAFNDAMAIGAARAALNVGVPIPQQLKLWGYGDYPESEDFKIPISSHRAPVKAVNERAFSWLLERMEDPTIEPRFVELKTETVERESSK